jgi:hypothetical protein
LLSFSVLAGVKPPSLLAKKGFVELLTGSMYGLTPKDTKLGIKNIPNPARTTVFWSRL